MSDTLASNRPDTTTHAIRAWQNAPDEPLLLPVGRVAELKYYVARRRGKLAAVLTFTALAAALLVLTPAPVQQATPPVGIAQAPISGPIPPPVAAPPAPKPPPPPPAPAPAPKPAPVAAPPKLPAPETPPFIAALNADGIGISEHGAAITDAHIVCVNLARGIARSVVVAEVQQNTSNYTSANASDFVDLSVAFYCPQYNS